ncbi:major facilitator superfamily transporter [Colletotrichum abscissum]|uniref:Major facilitator superfamily transporter n=1 Tax=Colletotrichum abscissum TaxID=1671311 RepID=A0A9Q0AVN8_9PEZI|nr:major facilitator superfamily transporter [Colletotrichum abscissum]
MAAFRGGQDVANLGLALFLIDFIIEPLIWGHTSEVYGRRILMIDTLGLSSNLNLSAAQASGILTVMISQLLSTFGSSPYLADSPRSAQAVQSAGSGMIRDLLDVAFPMFTTKMY